jgi:DNA mismatch endonuclease, patch repair protein
VSGVPAQAWKARPGRSRANANVEQDKAAGGRHRRAVRLDDGETTLGSVVLKPHARTNVVHAYLRWRADGRSVTRTLGPVTSRTRIANLTAGWDRARAEGLVHDEVLPEESWASSTEVRASMRANRGRDTTPELRLRSLLYARGLRYRVSTRPVPSLRRTADVVFPGARVAVFVDGCYWHGCPEHHRPATKNSQFWRTKIADNQRRDAETNSVLESEGWTVIRCWEHEDPVSVADRVVNTLEQKTDQRR